MDSLIIYNTQYKKERIGRPYDGGYCICDIPVQYDCLMSGGIANDISFEQAFLNKHPAIPCFAFDGTIRGLPVADSRIQFVNKNLGNKETDTLTNLHSILEPYSNVFMKIDIEGHEFRLFPTFSDIQMNKIAQLVLEIHSPGDIKLHPTYFAGLHDITDPIMIELLQKINKTHTLVHLHPNNGCNTYYVYPSDGNRHHEGIHMPNVFECTYIRNDLVTQRSPNREPLPLPIDMPNVPSKGIVIFDKYPFVVSSE